MWSHRVLRHTVFICASRSLSVQASACRSSVPPNHSLDDKGGSGTLVFIDVENINTVRHAACHIHAVCSFLLLHHSSLFKLCFNLPPLGSQSEAGVREFHIVQVSSSSQHWRLQRCINPAKEKGVSGTLSHLCFILQWSISFYSLLFTAWVVNTDVVFILIDLSQCLKKQTKNRWTNERLSALISQLVFSNPFQKEKHLQNTAINLWRSTIDMFFLFKYNLELNNSHWYGIHSSFSSEKSVGCCIAFEGCCHSPRYHLCERLSPTPP